jgi:hypothetical protein
MREFDFLPRACRSGLGGRGRPGKNTAREDEVKDNWSHGLEPGSNWCFCQIPFGKSIEYSYIFATIHSKIYFRRWIMPAAKGTIKFVNASEFDASVYVLDERKNEAFKVDLAPGESSVQDTAEGQVWIVKDKETGREVGTVRGTTDRQTFEIKFKRGRGEPVRSGSGGG